MICPCGISSSREVISLFGILLALVIVTSAKDYYVKPSSSIPCPKPCFTLSQYAEKPNGFFHSSDTTLYLLPGNHSLDSELFLKNKINLTILAYPNTLTTAANVTITCTNMSGIMITDTERVKIEGIVFVGCVNTTMFTISNSVIMRNSTFHGQGLNGTGLILRNVSSANISRSSFSNFTGTLVITTEWNRAKGGGAIVIQNCGNVTIEDSVFTFNSVGMFERGQDKEVLGGALYSLNSNVYISRCTFDANVLSGYTSAGSGGAVYAQSGVLYMEFSNFTNNAVYGVSDSINAIAAIGKVSKFGSYGGAVYANRSTVTIFKCEFSNNSLSSETSGFGGAVYVIEGNVMFSVIESIFIGNSIVSYQGNSGKGGAVYIRGNAKDLVTCTSIENTTFIDNFVDVSNSGYGGAVYATGSTVTILMCEFSNNSLSSDTTGFGGAVYVIVSFKGDETFSVIDSTFSGNSIVSYLGNSGKGKQKGGGAIVVQNCGNVTIEDSVFTFNSIGMFERCQDKEVLGGALYSLNSNVYLSRCTFDANVLSGYTSAGSGGAVYAQSGVLYMEFSNFSNNAVYGVSDSINAIAAIGKVSKFGSYGGAVYANRSTVTIFKCEFSNNSLSSETSGFGGAVYVIDGNDMFSVIESIFSGNSIVSYQGNSGKGGAVYIRGNAKDIVTCTSIENTTFIDNFVDVSNSGYGGAIYSFNSNVTVTNSVLESNAVVATKGQQSQGGAIYLSYSNFWGKSTLCLQYNSANSGVIYAKQSTLKFPGETDISNNIGSLFLFASSVEINGTANISNNSAASSNSKDAIVEGGALTGIQSNITLKGKVSFTHNTARSGGGIYACQTEVNFMAKSTIVISNNVASVAGGGIHCITDSSINIASNTVTIASNHAAKGGGVGLAQNSKLYILKTWYNNTVSENGLLTLDDNSADYGGAIYVADNTNLDTCNANISSHSTESECFFQVSTFNRSDVDSSVLPDDSPSSSVISINFTNNYANVSGKILYGGLLDRCTPSNTTGSEGQFGNTTEGALTAASFFLKNTNLDHQVLSTESISSDAVRVCFCEDNEPDCGYQTLPKVVNKGETFIVSVVVVDHLNHSIANATIYAVISVEADLGERQSVQSTNENGTCSNLTYSILSVRDSENLTIHAKGPCNNIGMSSSNLTVTISPCPIGFEESSNNYHCECHPDLFPKYVTNCSINTESVWRKRNTLSWFNYTGNTTKHPESFILYENCPYDYCIPSFEDVSVNLNNPYGSDALCSFQRSGKLCGSCKENLSLTFGGSECLECSDKWLGMIVVFAIAGVLLVAIIFICNLTVAVGTINGLIFYANVIAANQAMFFPFKKLKVFSVFIAWVNLDFGFTSCFYNGMDGYVKTWLQFVFPCYILFLVTVMFIIANHSHRFSELLRHRCKNPVAALSTLVLLSYTKFLRIIITIFSSAALTYSDGDSERVWLFDASIGYVSCWKHSLLFFVAFIVLLIGVSFTLLILFWHWLDSDALRKKPVIRWLTNSSELRDFIKTYQDPYESDHHYWTGVLLLVRVVLYVIISVCKDADKKSIVILIIVGGLLFFKNLTGRVYKKKAINILESSCIFNLTLFAAIALHLNESDNKGQLSLACISISFYLLAFVATILYHVYVYMLKRGEVFKTLFSRSRHRKCSIQFPANLLSSHYHDSAGTLSTRPLSWSEVEKPSIEDTLRLVHEESSLSSHRKQLEIKVLFNPTSDVKSNVKTVDDLKCMLDGLDIEETTMEVNVTESEDVNTEEHEESETNQECGFSSNYTLMES